MTTTVGIDIGTSSVKGVLVNDDGVVLRRVRVPHTAAVPAPDRLEHDADQAWRRNPLRAWRALVAGTLAAGTLAEGALAEAPPSAAAPAAAAVSAMVPSLTAVDRRGRPLSPGLLYGDGRGRTASGASPADNGEAREFLRWTAAQVPEAHGFWPAPAVANMALSGNGVIDIATAFTMSPLFGRSGWDAAVCADCGVGVDALPTIAMTGRPIGAIRGSSAVLVAGSIDAMGDQIISGANDPGDVLVLCGTTMITWVVTAEPVAVPQLWTVPHHFGALSMVGGPSNAGGLFLNWARSLLGRSSGSAALEPGRVPVWAPYPRGERTPLHDPDRRAVVDGLDLTHSPAAVRRAAYEAAGFVVRHHIDRSGQPASRIVATGGGTRDPEWMQALADCTGLSVWVSAVPEGAAVGMAYVARLGVGLETDLSGADRWARTSHVVDPDPRWVAPSAARYQRFLELSAGGSGEPD